MDSFAFMVTDKGRTLQVLREHALPDNVLLHPGPAAERLGEIVAEEDLLRARYEETHIALLSPLYTLIPEALFLREAEKAYLEQLTTLGEGMVCRGEFVPEHECWNVFGYPGTLLDQVQAAFPEARFAHHLTAQLKGLHHYLPRSGEAAQLFLHLWKAYVQALVFREGKLVFANMFPYRHPQDVLYYLLLACRQADREPDDMKVYLSGGLADDSSLFIELCRLAPSLERLPLLVGTPESADTGKLEAYQDLFVLEAQAS